MAWILFIFDKKRQNTKARMIDEASNDWYRKRRSETRRSNLSLNYQFRGTRNITWQEQQTCDRFSKTGLIGELCYQLVSLSTKPCIDPFDGGQCRVVPISCSRASVRCRTIQREISTNTLCSTLVSPKFPKLGYSSRALGNFAPPPEIFPLALPKGLESCVISAAQHF